MTAFAFLFWVLLFVLAWDDDHGLAFAFGVASSTTAALIGIIWVARWLWLVAP